ncbi:hypothetical protein HPB51_028574 [Rhipicephalus microplus]|uniref:Uncharacterized protein n=1 Tax=Rhipicephalus microplus TaxID=6941 RepID=A0A9J6CWI4_RHIMP|nr:hypothetical protein HPB51_028574 [Rhipicephalus microplus]
MENIPTISEESSLLAVANVVVTPSNIYREDAEPFHLPCAANMTTTTYTDQVCPIKDSLPICNALFFDIGMERRPQRGGKLSLVCFKPNATEVVPCCDSDLYRATTFYRWLLRSHICITDLKLLCKWVILYSEVILEELPVNSRLRKLRLYFPSKDRVEPPREPASQNCGICKNCIATCHHGQTPS